MISDMWTDGCSSLCWASEELQPALRVPADSLCPEVVSSQPGIVDAQVNGSVFLGGFLNLETKNIVMDEDQTLLIHIKVLLFCNYRCSAGLLV